MQIIADEQELDAFIAHAGREKFIACDTEFVRVRTYYPELALIQIATSQRVVLIDPLLINNWEGLKSLFENKDIVKVFHAPRQDLEILRHSLGIHPVRTFDTQIAASFLGLPDQMGYEALVREMLDIQLDKSAQFTNWLERPLSDAQLTYAAADVIHLHRIYTILLDKLDERAAWVDTVCSSYDVDSFYQVDLVPAFLKWVPKLKQDDHKIRLWLALNWREARAQKINRPKTWILKDSQLLEIARGETEDIPSGLIKILKQEMASARPQVKAILEAALKPLSSQQKDKLKLLREQFSQWALTHQMPARFAASKSELEHYIRTKTKPETLTIWQKTLFWDKVDEPCDI